MQLPERIDRVREGTPGGNGIGKRFLFCGSRFEPGSFSHPANHFSQDLAIRLILSAFCLGLEVTVERQNLGIRTVDRMLLENSLERSENACLPIDESTVAIEGDELKWGEIEHKNRPSV